MNIVCWFDHDTWNRRGTVGRRGKEINILVYNATIGRREQFSLKVLRAMFNIVTFGLIFPETDFHGLA